MATIHNELAIDAGADAVWLIVGDPSAVERWFRPVESVDLVDDLRICAMRGGGEVIERILEVDAADRRFSYSIIEGFPLESHVATVRVLESGTGSLVTYDTEVTPDSFAGGLDRSVEKALLQLRSLFDR